MLGGVIGGTIVSMATPVRESFTAAYTSWAAMAGYAGLLAKERSSLASGLAYMAASVVLGLAAWALGGGLAKALASSRVPAADGTVTGVRRGVLAVLFAFVAATYATVRANDDVSFNAAFLTDESGLPSLLSFLDEEVRPPQQTIP